MNVLQRELCLKIRPRQNHLLGSLNARERTVIELETGRWFVKHFLTDQYGETLNTKKKLYERVEKDLQVNNVNPFWLDIEFKEMVKKRKRSIAKYDGISSQNILCINTPSLMTKLKLAYPNIDVRTEINAMNVWFLKNELKVKKRRNANWAKFAFNWCKKADENRGDKAFSLKDSEFNYDY
jgi:hypothetical protein